MLGAIEMKNNLNKTKLSMWYINRNNHSTTSYLI